MGRKWGQGCAQAPYTQLWTGGFRPPPLPPPAASVPGAMRERSRARSGQAWRARGGGAGDEPIPSEPLRQATGSERKLGGGRQSHTQPILEARRGVPEGGCSALPPWKVWTSREERPNSPPSKQKHRESQPGRRPRQWNDVRRGTQSPDRTPAPMGHPHPHHWRHDAEAKASVRLGLTSRWQRSDISPTRTWHARGI